MAARADRAGRSPLGIASPAEALLGHPLVAHDAQIAVADAPLPGPHERPGRASYDGASYNPDSDHHTLLASNRSPRAVCGVTSSPDRSRSGSASSGSGRDSTSRRTPGSASMSTRPLFRLPPRYRTSGSTGTRSAKEAAPSPAL